VSPRPLSLFYFAVEQSQTWLHCLHMTSQRQNGTSTAFSMQLYHLYLFGTSTQLWSSKVTLVGDNGTFAGVFQLDDGMSSYFVGAAPADFNATGAMSHGPSAGLLGTA
jgi:hypothetical protein